MNIISNLFVLAKREEENMFEIEICLIFKFLSVHDINPDEEKLSNRQTTLIENIKMCFLKRQLTIFFSVCNQPYENSI